MSPQYSLICTHCQHSNVVTTTQAGQNIDCAGCQQSIQAPRLGQLKQLPMVEAAAPVQHKESSKGGKLFVLGMLMLIFGGGGGAGLYYYASGKLFDYETVVEEEITKLDSWVDGASLIEQVQLYETMPLEAGLPAWEERPYVGQNKQGLILRNLSYGLLAIGGIGLICAVIGFLK